MPAHCDVMVVLPSLNYRQFSVAPLVLINSLERILSLCRYITFIENYGSLTAGFVADLKSYTSLYFKIKQRIVWDTNLGFSTERFLKRDV